MHASKERIIIIYVYLKIEIFMVLYMYLVKDVLTFHHMRENKTELFWPTKDQYCIHGTSHLQSIFR